LERPAFQESPASFLTRCYDEFLSQPARTTFSVRSHLVTLECLEKHRWRVSVDGQLVASFCSESRARAAGRTEARRRDFVASDLGGRLAQVRDRK